MENKYKALLIRVLHDLKNTIDGRVSPEVEAEVGEALREHEYWGIWSESEGGKWWPRSFRTEEEAEAHLQRCGGPGTVAKVWPRPRTSPGSPR